MTQAPATANNWRPGASRAMLIERAHLLGLLRSFMASRQRLEVDTALLASAGPAERSLDCLSVDEAGYLVPSPEHALKRLLAAGMGPVYQLSHVFRAGEVGRWHNPEFAMLEWYSDAADLASIINETAALLAYVGVPAASPPQRYDAVFRQATGLDALNAPVTALAAFAEARGLAPAGADPDRCDRMFWLDLLMSLVVQPSLGQDRPAMVTHFPVEDAVLIASDPQDARLGLRFECYWQGVELANGAVELRDATLARERMMREQTLKTTRGLAPGPLDEHLLSALEAGLPPCAGVALGVDRLLALRAGASGLDSVLPFSWLRR